jgi:hypothetical protein
MIDENPETSEQEPTSPELGDEKPTLKENLRGGAAKVFGVAVEVGSLLGGESGQIVEAERELAEANAEDLIDKLDGEG